MAPPNAIRMDRGDWVTPSMSPSPNLASYSSQYTPVRSLACMGASFHRPFSLASHTPVLASWNRKALTASSAILRCARYRISVRALSSVAASNSAMIALNSGL